MPDKVFIRNVPDDLWRALKAKASLEGITLSSAVTEAVEAYLNGVSSRKGQNKTDPWKAITALGKSGKRNVAARHDHYLAEALKRKCR